MKKPNFLILGAAKSGTNTLYHYLGQHPDVFVSTPKEPFFFEAEYERGLHFYWDTYFKGYEGQRAVGEARVANLLLPYVPPRVKESLPDARLITILRNPVDRAYSHWWMRYARGIEKLSFSDALRENLARIEAGLTLEGEEGERLWRANVAPDKTHVKLSVYLDAGCYAEQVKRYLQLFPTSQIKILLFDDLRQQPKSVFRELCEFLGVDPDIALGEVEAQNVSFTTAAIPFLRLEETLKISRFMPKKLSSSLRNLLARFGSPPEMDNPTRRWLADHYFPHNRDLERIIGRDLSHWDKFDG